MVGFVSCLLGWLGAEALRRLSAAPLTDQKRFLLGECVQAYLPLDDVQRGVFEGIIQGTEHAGVKAMNQTVYEKGIEKGQIDLIAALLEARFGSVPGDLPERLRTRTPAELRKLAVAINAAESLDALGL